MDEGKAFSPFVNLNFYRASNPDLAAVGITTNRQLFDHLQNYGVAEERRFSPLVDLNFYRDVHGDLASFSNAQTFEHLQNYGVAEGRRFSPLVDLNFYRKSNQDLDAVGITTNRQLFEHLQNYGVAEGRRFSQFFDTGFYLAAYDDLRTAFSNTPKNDRVEALEHLVIYGLSENRSFSQFFDINYYRSNNSDLVSVGLNSSQKLLAHFEKHGLAEGRSFSAALNVNYYRNTYSDLAAANLTNWQLYEHFQINGLGEARASSQFFNVKFYLEGNTDLRAANYNYAQAYDHFVLYGQSEGRSGVNNLQQNWIRQMGTAGDDYSNSVATDSAGNVYITGYTDGSLGGTNAGGRDAWLAKYNSGGTLLWTKQLGTTNDDLCLGVTADSAGNVYITGDTDGALGGTNAGGRDAWVAKYNSGGTLLWTKQLGNAGDDFSYGVASDSAGNIYITGYTDGSLGGTNAGNRDAWLAKYNSSGTLLWTKQLGTSGDDSSYSIAVDANGNVYITGDTDGALGGSNVGSDTYDSWIAKYNSNGALLWTRQLGTVGDDFSYSVAVDGTGNVYITGDTDGSLGRTSAGDVDAWVAKYDSSGNQLFIRQLGTSSQDSSIAIAVDSFGNFYITGDSSGALGGTNAGNADAWLAKYDSSGNQLFIRKLGTSSLDSSYGVAIDNTGNVYITGYTGGALAGNNVGNLDAWVAKYR